ncbi:hypothetical protein HPP92_009979 [Vanilla planifolia]|uniref:Uncharacterized protein n=1 Tax=Vanilla planifolia TaxID=51239 RepID=A0A835R5H7_VANPL|nr:hypothetical protein HPP92_009979 [Vanilla planifolia]
MGAAWTECLQPFDSRSVSGLDFSALCYKYVAVLVNSFALARNMQRLEMERRVQEFWKLDMTEGSSRMRRFLKRNYKNSYLNRVPYDEDKIHLNPMEETDDHGDLVTSVLKYSATILTPDAMSFKGEHNDYDQPGCGILLDDVKNQHISNFDEYGALFSQNPGAFVHQNLVKPSAGLAPGYVPCEADERIILELPSLMVRSLKVVSGTFQITTKRINFIVGELTSDEFIIEGFAASAHGTFCNKDRCWSISSLRQVFCRRYLLRRSALELFMADRSNFLFDFGTVEGCKNAFRAIVQAHPLHMHNEFIAIQRPEEFIKRTQLTERWARWEISNFEYLMELNTLSGRSYNDITQVKEVPG